MVTSLAGVCRFCEVLPQMQCSFSGRVASLRVTGSKHATTALVYTPDGRHFVPTAVTRIADFLFGCAQIGLSL